MAEQAAAELSDALRRLDLAKSEYLLFNPTGSRAWLKETFDKVPRYLFHITTPKSNGTTDRFWVKSRDALHEHGNCTKTCSPGILILLQITTGQYPACSGVTFGGRLAIMAILSPGPVHSCSPSNICATCVVETG